MALMKLERFSSWQGRETDKDTGRSQKGAREGPREAAFEKELPGWLAISQATLTVKGAASTYLMPGLSRAVDLPHGAWLQLVHEPGESEKEP